MSDPRVEAAALSSVDEQLRAHGPWRCCPHCADDELHGPNLTNAHEIPCDLCLLDRAAYEKGRADAVAPTVDRDTLDAVVRAAVVEWNTDVRTAGDVHARDVTAHIVNALLAAMNTRPIT